MIWVNLVQIRIPCVERYLETTQLACHSGLQHSSYGPIVSVLSEAPRASRPTHDKVFHRGVWISTGIADVFGTVMSFIHTLDTESHLGMV